MPYASLVISGLALLFTVAGFWWMNWRRSNLRVSTPRTYAAVGSRDVLLVKLPFVFYNDRPGAGCPARLRRYVAHAWILGKANFRDALRCTGTRDRIADL